MKVYGLKVPQYDQRRGRSVLGDIEKTLTGNVVLRVGQENVPTDPELSDGSPKTWHQTEHVVLTPDEALEVIEALQATFVDADARTAALAEHPCPRGDECALNRGAIHCFACSRNWPPDLTWDLAARGADGA